MRASSEKSVQSNPRGWRQNIAQAMSLKLNTPTRRLGLGHWGRPLGREGKKRQIIKVTYILLDELKSKLCRQRRSARRHRGQ